MPLQNYKKFAVVFVVIVINKNTILQPYLDEQLGYGYQIWKTRNGGFCFYGIGGQLAVCLPKQDFILVTMADTLNNSNGIKDIYDAFFQHIYPYLAPAECSKRTNELNQSLTEVVSSLSASSVQDISTFEFETFIWRVSLVTIRNLVVLQCLRIS